MDTSSATSLPEDTNVQHVYTFELSEKLSLHEPGYFQGDRTTVRRDCDAIRTYLSEQGLWQEGRDQMLVRPWDCQLTLIIGEELSPEHEWDLFDQINQSGDQGFYSLKEHKTREI